MDLKHLEKLAKLCRKHGISHLKSADLELQFDLSHDEAAQALPPATDIAPTPAYSDEDTLLWSSAGPTLE